MRFQFSTRQILLATAFVAITCGGVGVYRQIGYQPPVRWSIVVNHVAVSSPLWVPSLFFVYAIGRRAFTTRLVVTFALMELLACIISYAWGHWLYV